MENFNSIFELLAAFNFAYVLSDDFKKGFDSYVSALKNYEMYEGEIRTLQDNLASNKVVSNLKSPISNALATFVSKVTEGKERVSKTLTEFQNDLTFNYLCLNAALYCFFVLLMNGCGWLSCDSKHEISMFFVFNCLVLFSVVLIARRPTLYFVINYYAVCWQFIVILALTSLFNFLFKIGLDCSMFESCHGLNFVFALIVGCINFVFAFYTAEIKNRKEGRNFLKKEADDLNIELAILTGQVTSPLNKVKLKVDRSGNP
jgi:hypothetical protein